MRKHLVFPLLAVVWLSACASSKTATPTTTETIQISGVAGTNAQGPSGSSAVMITSSTATHTRTFPVALDQVWGLMPSVYDSLGIPISQIETQNHVIGNPSFAVRRRLGKTPLGRYLDCGSTQGANSVDTYDINLSVTSKVVAESPSATTVATTVEARGKPVFASSEWSRCTSTGRLETAILNGVAARLK